MNNKPPIIKILIVDDHELVREGVRLLLESLPHMQVSIDEASNGSEAIRKCNGRHYDVILMDIRMPGIDGITATAEILKKSDTKIVGLTMHAEEAFAEKMLQAGAKGYILKNAGSGELEKAINRVMQGGLYFSSDISNRLLERRERDKMTRKPRLEKRPEYALLSGREKEILKMIADQYTNDQIASELNLSKRTVDSHRRNIMMKLNVKNTAGLIKSAMEMNLL
jgi:DNA-binding NarL/FixJ family response regulator